MNLSRRQFLAASGAVGGILGAGLAVDAFEIEPRRVQVTRHDVPVRGLPPALEGLRIVQVSDVHLYDGIHAPGRVALDLIAGEHPDVVLLTGDICEAPENMPELMEFTSAAKGRLGTFAIYGNWERWAGIDDATLAAAYQRAGATLLVNQAATLDVGGTRLSIIGLDDVLHGGANLARARAMTQPEDVSIWMVHEPGWVDRVPWEASIPPAMILSGHSHGGQIRLPLLPPWLPPGCGRFVEGWYRDTYAPLYVSRGIGTADIRARFRCPPELPVFVLRTAPGTRNPGPA